MTYMNEFSAETLHMPHIIIIQVIVNLSIKNTCTSELVSVFTFSTNGKTSRCYKIQADQEKLSLYF